MLAMFLAQMAHESEFAHLEEIKCQGNKCPNEYGSSGGVQYYGRGFIQLTWKANYEEASKALGMGDQLVKNPEKVGKDVSIAARVSIWFWDTKVLPKPGVKEMKQFGLTTKAINGSVECTGSNVEQSKRRYKIYQAVAKAMKLTNLAAESGCY